MALEVAESPLPFPASDTSGRCPECHAPIDDPIHHFIVSPELRGKSTEQGNRYYHVRKPEFPVREEAP